MITRHLTIVRIVVGDCAIPNQQNVSTLIETLQNLQNVGIHRNGPSTNQSERTTNFLSWWMGGYGRVLWGASSVAISMSRCVLDNGIGESRLSQGYIYLYALYLSIRTVNDRESQDARAVSASGCATCSTAHHRVWERCSTNLRTSFFSPITKLLASQKKI